MCKRFVLHVAAMNMPWFWLALACLSFGPTCVAAQDEQPDSTSVTFSGRVHRVVMSVADGVERKGFFMDSDQGPTMARVDAVKISGAWLIRGALEVGVQSNRASRVSQDQPNPGTDLTVRTAEFVIEHQRFGTASFGRGFAAAWVVPEIDLSGTAPAALLASGNLAPGMKFVDGATSELSAVQVSDHFADTERLLLTDRFRYDSPRLAGVFQLSGSVGADSRWDAALRVFPSVRGWLIRGAATYLHEPFGDFDYRAELGLTVRHERTGLSVSGGGTRGRAADDRVASAGVIKAGWLFQAVTMGETAVSVDYSSGSNASLDGDSASSFGVFALQKWGSVGLDFYLGYRRYEVERPDLDLLPLNTLTLGVILAFGS
jgi:hypothetical protein